ncbi:ABC transporter ATP-binding protein [Alicyclobacillus shizuokensis]|uniref:ABC transporter ATP-binding protein n=1 Tax=Alicyclobacillus shizuokensis TaxID=392014 RepID=UPI0008356598|nr:ABC transporter ATP-binding protein [Alicyclobacillus shizuokensis]MCL6626271.1 ABC transporter ATP-binding protein [Alicyclobacillus shizuokensis]
MEPHPLLAKANGRSISKHCVKPSVIEVKNLQKRYGQTVAVEDISFRVETGEIFVLVGPNGAGKTTIVECMEGLRVPDGGLVRILGLDPRKDRARIFQQVGVQLQEDQLLPRQKLIEALKVFASFYADPFPYKELMEACGLSGLENKFFGKLSGGQKRRFMLVLALIGRPKLVMLDEPTSGLDPQARFNIWSMLEQFKREGMTIFLTTHDMNEAEEHADTLCMVDHGKVIAMGAPKELLQENQMGVMVKIPDQRNCALDELENIPHLGKLEKVQSDYLLYGIDSEFLPSIHRYVQAKGIPLDEIETRKANLEDLYLFMTGRVYRKE